MQSALPGPPFVGTPGIYILSLCHPYVFAMGANKDSPLDVGGQHAHAGKQWTVQRYTSNALRVCTQPGLQMTNRQENRAEAMKLWRVFFPRPGLANCHRPGANE